MFNDYQIPSIVLIAALMLAFIYLHLRFRSVRTLLWILALGCAELQGILLWVVAHCATTIGGGSSPSAILARAAAESALLVSSVLFLASLSPLSFQIGRTRILYAVPYLVPLLLYSVLYSGISPYFLGISSQGSWAAAHLVVRQSAPSFVSGTGTGIPGVVLIAYGILAIWAAGVAFVWSLQKGAIPIWLATAIVAIGGAMCVPSFLHGNVYWPLLVAESGNMLMTALLVVYHYRRFSPGVVLAVSGFAAWALLPLLVVPLPGPVPSHGTVVGLLGITLARIVILGKVVVAMGLILLVLEEQVQKNQEAQQRERRVRIELEAYARQALTARSLEEFDRDSAQICAMIVEHSCFHTAAMMVRSASGGFSVVGYAGMDGATAGALDAAVHRLPANCFSAPLEPLVPDSMSFSIDLSPWLSPGDDLERLHLTRIGSVPMLGPDNTAEGAILISGPCMPLQTLRADDLLPLEILAGRLQAARGQSMMLGKLIESERFAGVGQLATNVAQQLNNPLTVILGYSALLEEAGLPGSDQRAAEAITVEARRMKAILERLSRFSRLSSERFNSFSIADLVADIEQLHRTDFLRHSIEFRLLVAPGLPAIFGNAHQIRQALLHATQFAIDSVLRVEPFLEKSIRIEATSDDGRVHIRIAHSGHGFAHPDRAFDALATGFSTNESTGIGLSLCAAIIREHRGSISALNLTPTGAAIVVDLPIS